MITRSSAAGRRRGPQFTLKALLRRPPRWRSREGLGLASAALVALAAIALVTFAKRPMWADFDARLARGELLDISKSPSSADLAGALGVIKSPVDRRFAAERIARALADRKLTHVGEIAQIWVTEKEIQSVRGLESYPRRLAEARRVRQERASQASVLTRWKTWAIEESGLAEPPELRVPLFAPGQFAETKSRLIVRTPAELGRSLALAVALLFVGFAAVHTIWSVGRFRGDEVILPSLLLLSGLSLALMMSLRDPLRDAELFANVGRGTLVGCVVLILTSLIDYERLASRLAYVPLAASILLSVALIVFGSGPAGSDAKVNLLGVQPVEAIKLLLVFFFAGFFAPRWEALRHLRERRPELGRFGHWFSIPRLDHLLPVLACVVITLVFFFLQKDLGPALIMSCVFLSLYGVVRQRVVLVLAGLAAIAAGFAGGYAIGYPATVSSRIHMWLSPWDNLARGGDQLAHSLWALSSGGLRGTGLGLGSPAYVPAGHTDLILSCAGEELGFAGLLALGLVFALLVRRGLQIALGSTSDYNVFLALGLTALIATQILLISGGLLGLVPLTGVPTLLLSHGSSARCASFAAFGMLAAISATGGAGRRAQPSGAPSGPSSSFRRPVGVFGVVLLTLGSIALGRAAYVQLLEADETVVAGTLTVQADLQRRFQYNPRILQIARGIPRGTILDRNGLPLATSDWSVLEHHRAEYERLGISIDRACDREDDRHYPLGGPLFHVLGDLRTRVNWGASNTSFLERDAMMQLQGYDTRPHAVDVSDPVTGRPTSTLAYDYRDLVPLLRHRFEPDSDAVRRVMDRPRDLRTTIDARLQLRVAAILTKRLEAAGRDKGAVVVLDAASGDLLASVSHPWPDLSEDDTAPASRKIPAPDTGRDDQDRVYLDRARYGLYPPGSTFKLVVATAALVNGTADLTFTCVRLRKGVGARIPRWGTLRDDVRDTIPHGTIGLERALAVSCNAYFGQLAVRTGAPALHAAASAFGISVARPNTPELLARTLAPAGFGQGEVVASPLQLAGVAAMVANDGAASQVRWTVDANAIETPPRRILPDPSARRLARAMRSAVTSGTGRKLLDAMVPVAGKTGTAEVHGKPSHAWFAGFAPYEAPTHRIAFAVLVENGGYGGGIAASVAADVVDAVHRLELDQ